MSRLEGESFDSFQGEEACRERKRASEQVDGMKVVVLGGNGELGSYLCPHLVRCGHEVVAVNSDDMAPYTRSASEWDKITTMVKDRRGSEEEVTSFGSTIAGLAGQVVVDTCCYEDYHCKLLVNALQDSSSLEHFIHCGSLRTYNPSVQRPWREDGPRGLPCGYSSQQQQQMEARLHELYKSANFPATVLLLAELVGEGWCPLTFQGLYDPLCFQALSEGKWVMVPERNTTLQFLDVRDAVDAICRMMDKRADALGESFNLGGSPLTLSDYANLVARSNGWKAPVDIKLRKWLDFSYAIDKHNIYHDPDTWLAPEAADMLWRACMASPNKAVETLGCSFRNQAETLGQAARWCVDNMEAARRPRAPAVPLIRGEGRLEPFVAAEAYAGRRDGYIFKNGRHGKGYYIDLGPYVDFQQASWRRLYKQKTTGPEDMEKYDGLFGKVMIMYSIMLAGLLAFLLLTEAGQAHVVYMAWVSTHLTSMPRLVPKPFTVSLRLTRSKDLEELGVWHNLLPNKGYQGKFTPEERAQAPTKCRTVIYMHGNAENRNKQAWKYRWYHEEADAHVVAFDYRGFGDSTCPKIAFDTCLREAALYQDALHVFELVTNSTEQGGYGVPPSCVIFHGHSLGSAVAVRVAHALSAHLKTQIGGLILENALVSALEVSASSSMSPISQLPEPLPSMWKDFMRPRLKHELDSGKYIANVSVPVLMLHGNEDWIVPAAHTTALFQARESAGDGGACQESESGAPCSDVLFVDGAGHQEVLRDTQAKRKVLTFANEIWKAASARADR